MPPKNATPASDDKILASADANDPRYAPLEEPTDFEHVVVLFAELPLPGRDKARLNPCTVRFSFTGPFKNNKQFKAEKSFLAQLKTYFRRHGVENAGPGIQFPTGVGRGKFVDITVGPLNLDILAKAPLRYNNHPLDCAFVGPKLPHNAIILEVVDIPTQLDSKSAAQSVALQLRGAGSVLDVWKVYSFLGGDYADSTNQRLYTLAVVLLPHNLPSGKQAVHAFNLIPGYIKLSRQHCMVKFDGRPDWCGRCKSDATFFHVFGQCQRLECFHCKARGHAADLCPEKLLQQQAEEQAKTDPKQTNPKDRPAKRPIPGQ